MAEGCNPGRITKLQVGLIRSFSILTAFLLQKSCASSAWFKLNNHCCAREGGGFVCARAACISISRRRTIQGWRPKAVKEQRASSRAASFGEGPTRLICCTLLLMSMLRRPLLPQGPGSDSMLALACSEAMFSSFLLSGLERSEDCSRGGGDSMLWHLHRRGQHSNLHLGSISMGRTTEQHKNQEGTADTPWARSL